MNDDGRLERLNYFYGALLTPDDLIAEQEYFLEKQRRHNRYLHGWGVVTGLSVSMDDDTVVVEPGVAIDCAGNDIFLEKQTECAVSANATKLYVVVEYCESKVGPVPQLENLDDDLCQKLEYSRIQEACRVYVTDVDSSSGHDGIGPGSYGCGRQHPVAVACLSNEPKAWRVIPCGQR